MPLEFRSATLAETFEVWAGETLLGVIHYDRTWNRWCAKVNGHTRHLLIFGQALNFVESVRETNDWCDLRMPIALLHDPKREQQPLGRVDNRACR